MGQIEVYEWLKNQRLCGLDDFFSVHDISKGLLDSGITNGRARNVWAAVVQLESYGYLDVKMNGKYRDWKRLFRLKDDYLK